MLNPFTPSGTVSLAVTGSTGSVALSGISNQVRIASLAANAVAFVNFGGSDVEAATTDTPILPGTVEIFTVQPSMTHVAAIGTSSTTLYFTSGDGE